MAQIEYKNITKDYDVDDRVLDNVSFKVEKGEFVFLVGPSGSGKTTLIKLLIREELPTEGEIWFEGLGAVEDAEAVESIASDVETVSSLVNIFDLPHDRLPELRRRIGVVFQDFKVLNSKNVFENVAVALEVAGATLNEIKNIVPNVLGLVGLSDKAEHFPKQLSGGEIQRLSIARALAHEPEILVADEPTGNLDMVNSYDIVKLLLKINELGTTVVLATHDKEVINALEKRVITLDRGRIIRDEQKGKYILV